MLLFYPDRETNPKFNKKGISKPLLENQEPVKCQSVRFQKFGMNLGPSIPVKSTGKYVNQSLIVQSPMIFAAKPVRGLRDTNDSTLVNQNHLVKKLQESL